MLKSHIFKQLASASILLLTLMSLNTNTPTSASNPTTSEAENSVYIPFLVKDYSPPSNFGVEFEEINIEGGLEQMKSLRPTWARRNGVLWSLVSPNDTDERQWENLSELENELENASKSGLSTVLVIRSTPTWAQKVDGSYCGPIKEDALDDFANFLSDLVTRYSVSPYNIKYWELGNEPDVAPELVSATSSYGCWGDSMDSFYGGGYYAEMLKLAYPAIKAADPEAQVIIGGLLLHCNPYNPPAGESCIASRFLEGILRNDGGDYFDGVSFHSYDYYDNVYGRYRNPYWLTAWNTSGVALNSKADYLLKLLNHPEFGAPGKFLMNTETALICASCIKNNDYEITKAQYLVKSYAASMAKGLQANIWYSATGWRNSGLVDEVYKPLPAYHAYAFARRQIGDATFSTELSYDLNGDLSIDVTGYEFTKNSHHIWVIWSSNGRNQSLTLPDSPTAMYSFKGESLTVNGNKIYVGIMPMYLEFKK